MGWNVPEEIHDDVPLSQEERERLIVQGTIGRSALVNRAAMKRKTPMELIASGEVTVHMPQRFEDDRTLPVSTEYIEVEVFGGTVKITKEMLDSFDVGRGVLTNSKPIVIKQEIPGQRIELSYGDPYPYDDDICDAEIVEDE